MGFHAWRVSPNVISVTIFQFGQAVEFGAHISHAARDDHAASLAAVVLCFHHACHAQRQRAASALQGLCGHETANNVLQRVQEAVGAKKCEAHGRVLSLHHHGVTDQADGQTLNFKGLAWLDHNRFEVGVFGEQLDVAGSFAKALDGHVFA
jgi:hypothetical protein